MGQQFAANVAGVTQKNDDRSSRQKILKKSRYQRTADLYRDPFNLHDRNAFAVFTSHGQIGWLPKDIAAQIAPDVDAGKARYVVSYLDIKQWDKDGETIWVASVKIESRSMKTGEQPYLDDRPKPPSNIKRAGKVIGFASRMVIGATKLTYRSVRWGIGKLNQEKK